MMGELEKLIKNEIAWNKMWNLRPNLLFETVVRIVDEMRREFPLIEECDVPTKTNGDYDWHTLSIWQERKLIMCKNWFERWLKQEAKTQ